MIVQNSLAATSTTASTAPGSSKSLGKGDFMKLLIAQLQHQNPLEPLKGTDFTAQLAQFSSVEQMFKVNDSLQGIQDSSNKLNGSLAVNLIGKQIEAAGNEINLGNAGSATLTFELAADAQETNISIHDQAGELVATISKNNLSAGKQELVWDGTNSAGQLLPAGTYTFQVAAKGADGNAVGSKTFTLGTIDGIAYEGSQVFATINGKRIPTQAISQIRQTSV